MKLLTLDTHSCFRASSRDCSSSSSLLFMEVSFHNAICICCSMFKVFSMKGEFTCFATSTNIFLAL